MMLSTGPHLRSPNTARLERKRLRLQNHDDLRASFRFARFPNPKDGLLREARFDRQLQAGPDRRNRPAFFRTERRKVKMSGTIRARSGAILLFLYPRNLWFSRCSRLPGTARQEKK